MAIASQHNMTSQSIRHFLITSQLDKLDTRVLLSKITGFSSAQLISRDESILSEAQVMRYSELYQRALAGEPIAYLLGVKEFYGREFRVTPSTLIPRPETELLVEKVLEIAKPNAKILDLGTGSGCIAVTLKLERPDLQVVAVDKFSEALQIAALNATNLNANVDLIQSDWFQNISERYDIIVSNPPYIESNDQHLANLQYEPQTALTDFADGLSCIRTILHESHAFMEKNGQILLEHGYNQGVAVRSIFKQNHYDSVITFCDYSHLERFTTGTYCS